MAPKLSERSQQDYKLIVDAMGGNQKAYTELLERYKNVIYYLLLKLIKNDRDAEELTIEVFEKAFLKIHQYTPEYAFCTWLFKIAYNYGLDYLRRKAKQKHISLDCPEEMKAHSGIFQIASSPDPEEILISEQKKNVMHAVVNKLKPHYRELVELHYFNEYSFVEIKDKLDMPLGTVKIRMFRSREILHNKLRTKIAAI